MEDSNNVWSIGFHFGYIFWVNLWCFDWRFLRLEVLTGFDLDSRVRVAKTLKVLGDPNRIKIVEMLRNGEQCQCDIVPLIKQSQPTVSRHLRLLEENGVLSSRRDGVKMMYRIADPSVLQIIELASSL